MGNIKFILYWVLLLKLITSFNISELSPFDECNKQNNGNFSSINTNTCTSLNSHFNTNKNKCCRITINYDLAGLKNNFSREWLTKFFDGNMSE